MVVDPSLIPKGGTMSKPNISLGEMQSMINAVQDASGHSVYGGSSIPRIVKCPASVKEGLMAGLKPESVYAAKGTMLHGHMERAFKSTDPREYILRQDIDIEDTALLLDAKDYVQEIIELHPEGGYEIKLEHNHSLASYGLPEVYGTCDVVIESVKRIDVIDYKFGYGVPVYAEENYQLISYLGMVVEYDPESRPNKEMHVHICQPPLQIFDDWRVDPQKLYEMILGDITDAINESRQPSPRYGPSVSACRFCNANMRCVERHSWLRKQANLIQQMSQNVSSITNEQWSQFLDGWEALKNAASQVEKFAMSEIMAGHDFPNYKLVAGRSTRKFKDEDAGKQFIVNRLGKKAYAAKEPPIISLSQAEKIDPSLKKDETWNEMVFKPEGAPKLVKTSDKGKAMTFGTAAIMSDIAAGKV